MASTTRRLAAILAADIAGDSRLMGADEVGTVQALREHRTAADPLIAHHGGRIVKTTGDGVLIEFGSVVGAVECALGLQRLSAERNAGTTAERRMKWRMGVHLGDVLIEGEDILGDGVNIAARLEGIAEPGGICISEDAFRQVRGKVEVEFTDLGEQNLKNIEQPMRVYGVRDRAVPLEPAMPATSRSSRLSEKPAIAVLPFVNMSGDPEQEFFADGIVEDIITRLAGWRAFPLIARTSTFSYRGTSVDIKKIGEELGAHYIVEGSVRKSGRRVRVTSQLIETDTGHHITAERYDRDLTDLFELQDEITHAIAGAIEPELLKFERERIAEKPQRSDDAYEHYQRGMWHHYRHNKADNVEAKACFRRALATDPDYPQATAALAISVLNAGFLNWSDDAERNYGEAFQLGETAIRLDPRYPTAHFTFGAACMYTHRSDRATAEMREATELNPSFAAAHATLGHLLAYDGRSEEAIPIVEKAIRLNPADPRLFIMLPALACAHYQLRHYEQAVEIGRRSWTLNRNWPTGLTYVIAGLAQLGRIEEAQAALTIYKALRHTDLAAWERLVRRLFKDQTAADHLVDGMRKAGWGE
jgi:adenylate cyclase